MASLAPKRQIMDTKDRIKLIMEDQHMTQQVFADFLKQSPATLSSIFTGRTRPTLNIVDAIKMKIPDISVEWLLYDTGDMYISHPDEGVETPSEGVEETAEPMLNFDAPTSPASNFVASQALNRQGVQNTHPNFLYEEMKKVDKEPRKVTEIRVYYDDQTYETFKPA